MEVVLVEPETGVPIASGQTDTLRLDDTTMTITYGNTPGNPLPNTGGMGTTLLTIVGAIMVALAAATLVARNRPRFACEGAPKRRIGRKGGLL